MILGVSGHRPDKVGGYSDNPWQRNCREAGKCFLLVAKPAKVITGMALGWDQWVAEICLELKIPYLAAVPFEGQEARWPERSRLHYIELLSQADDVVYVSPPPYAAWKMEMRNRWVVDHSDEMLFLWDGSAGGTHNCHEYAEKKQKTIHRLNPAALRP